MGGPAPGICGTAVPGINITGAFGVDNIPGGGGGNGGLTCGIGGAEVWVGNGGCFGKGGCTVVTLLDVAVFICDLEATVVGFEMETDVDNDLGII